MSTIAEIYKKALGGDSLTISNIYEKAIQGQETEESSEEPLSISEIYDKAVMPARGGATREWEELPSGYGAEIPKYLRVKEKAILKPLSEGIWDIWGSTTLPGRFVKGYARGGASMVTGIGGGFRWLGSEAVGKKIAEFGKSVEKFYEQPDPTFYDQLASGIGSLATFYLPGLGIARGVAALSLAPRLALWFGITSSSVLESFVEAGSNYEEALRRGNSVQEAQTAGNKTFWENLPVLFITNRLGLFEGKGSTLQKAFVTSLMEGSQELSQEVVGNIALHDPILQGTGTAFGVGAITGAGMSLVQAGAESFDDRVALRKSKQVLDIAKGKEPQPFTQKEAEEAEAARKAPVGIPIPQEGGGQKVSLASKQAVPLELSREADLVNEQAEVTPTKPTMPIEIVSTEVAPKINLTEEDVGELDNKLRTLVDKPDLLEDYKLTKGQAVLLLESLPQTAGTWRIPVWAIDTVKGEMQNIVEVLHGAAESARSEDQMGQFLRVDKQAARIQRLVDSLIVLPTEVPTAKPPEMKILEAPSKEVTSTEIANSIQPPAPVLVPKTISELQSEAHGLGISIKGNARFLQARIDKAKALLPREGLTEKQIIQMKKETDKKGVRFGRIHGQREMLEKIQETQNDSIALLQTFMDYADNHLTLEDKAKLKKLAANIKTPNQLARALTGLNEIEAISVANLRRRGMKTFRDLAKKLLASERIAATEKPRIWEYLREFNGRVANMTPEDILAHVEGLKDIAERGHAVLKTREALEEGRRTLLINRLAEQGVIPLEIFREKSPYKRATMTVSQKALDIVQNVRDWYNESAYSLYFIDTLLDFIDGLQNYKGVLMTNFKRAFDVKFVNYIVMRRADHTPLIKIQQKYEMGGKSSFRKGIEQFVRQFPDREEALRFLVESKSIEPEVIRDMKPLTQGEKKWITEFDKYLGKVIPSIIEVAQTKYNKDVGKVKNYSPIRRLNVVTGIPITDRLVSEVEDYSVLRRNPAQWFIKQRQGGMQPVDLDSHKIASRYIEDVSYFIATDGFIREMGRTIADPRFKNLVGDMGQDLLQTWVDLLARRGSTVNSVNEHRMNRLYRNTTLGLLAFRISATLVQQTALCDMAGRIGGYWLAEGAINYQANPEGWREFIRTEVPELHQRYGLDDPAFTEFIEGEPMEKAARLGSAPMRGVDQWTAVNSFTGSYLSHLAERGIRVKYGQIPLVHNEALYEALIDYRQSQASPFFKDLPLAISAGKGLIGSRAWNRTLLQFQTFMLKRWNSIRHDAIRYGIKGSDMKSKLKAIHLLLWVAFIAPFAERFAREEVTYWRKKFLGMDVKRLTPREFLGSWFIDVLEAIPFLGKVLRAKVFRSTGMPTVDAIAKAGSAAADVLFKWGKNKTELDKALEIIAFSGNALTLSGVPGAGQGEQIIREALRGLEPGPRKQIKFKVEKSGAIKL